MSQPTVGFIGLGIMGEPMALNVLKAGFSLVVHNRSRPAVGRLSAAGARDGRSPKGVGEQADIILTCLPDSPDVNHVLFGPQGVFEGISAGKLVADMSTISPIAVREFATRAQAVGVDMLDAPVSGGQRGAQQGTLSIMVGGSEHAYGRALPVFQAMGKTIVHMGASGAGQVTKACNQMMTGCINAGISEAMTFAAKAGVDPGMVRQVLLGGAGYSRLLESGGLRMIERNFTPGFKAKLHYKDLRICLEAARTFGMPLPTTALVHQFYTALIQAGHGELDFSALVTVFEQLAAAPVSAATKGE